MHIVDITIISIVSIALLLHIAELLLLRYFNSFYYTHGLIVRKDDISIPVSEFDVILDNIMKLSNQHMVAARESGNFIFVRPRISGADYLYGTGLSIKICFEILRQDNRLRIKYWSRYVITHRLLALAIFLWIYGIEFKFGSLDFSFMPEIVLALIFFALLIVSFFSSRSKTRQIVKGILGVTS